MSDEPRFLTPEEQIKIIEALRLSSTPVSVSEYPLPKDTESVLKQMRNAVIEECAKVAETCRVWDYPCATIAAAIRALKDKP